MGVRMKLLLTCVLMVRGAAGGGVQVEGRPADPGQRPMGPVGPRVPSANISPPPWTANAQAELNQRRGREERLVADGDKLVVLANQLKAELDKGSARTLSVTAMKRAEELEKLARSVRKELQY